MADFLAAATLNVSLHGQPLADVNDYWGPIESFPDAVYISQWLYPLGVLAPGTYGLELRCTLSQPVTDGFDTNKDGQADMYSGEIWNISMQIAVCYPLGLNRGFRMPRKALCPNAEGARYHQGMRFPLFG
jgi:hypothetical protein